MARCSHTIYNLPDDVQFESALGRTRLLRHRGEPVLLSFVGVVRGEWFRTAEDEPRSNVVLLLEPEDEAVVQDAHEFLVACSRPYDSALPYLL